MSHHANRIRAHRFHAASWLLAALALALLPEPARAQSSPVSAGSGTNLSSVEYFPPPNDQRVRLRLTGAEMSPLPNQLYDVTKLTIRQFNLAGQPEVVAEAPECIYAQLDRVVNSASPLDLWLRDGGVHVTGDGFLWQQADNSFYLSNNVSTVFMKKILSTVLASSAGAGLAAPNSAPAGPARQDFGIHSDHCSGDAQQVVWSDHVCVTNSQGQMTCEQLTVNFPQGDAADHHPTNAIAETNLRAAFYGKKGETNHLRADRCVYDFQVVHGVTNEIFTFTGDDVVLVNAQGRLACKRLTLHFPPEGSADSHPTNAVAETNLDIIFVNNKGETNHLTADKGVYDYRVLRGVTNEIFTFNGHVTNFTAKGWMTGEPLVWDNVKNSFYGVNVEMHFQAPTGTNGSPANLLK